MYSRSWSVLFALIVMAAGLTTQVPAFAQHEAGIRFDIGVPSGDFGDQADDPGFGLSGHYAFGVDSRLSFGVGMNFLIYGNETRDMDAPLVDDFEIVTTNNIAGLFVLSQYDLLTGRVAPYVEGRFGGNYLWTSSELQGTDWLDEGTAKEVNYDDFAWQYGFGGGLKILVRDGRGGDTPSIYIDCKVLAIMGSKAEYLTEGAIEIDGDQAIFNPAETETDLTHFEIGVQVDF